MEQAKAYTYTILTSAKKTKRSNEKKNDIGKHLTTHVAMNCLPRNVQDLISSGYNLF